MISNKKKVLFHVLLISMVMIIPVMVFLYLKYDLLLVISLFSFFVISLFKIFSARYLELRILTDRIIIKEFYFLSADKPVKLLDVYVSFIESFYIKNNKEIVFYKISKKGIKRISFSLDFFEEEERLNVCRLLKQLINK